MQMQNMKPRTFDDDNNNNNNNNDKGRGSRGKIQQANNILLL